MGLHLESAAQQTVRYSRAGLASLVSIEKMSKHDYVLSAKTVNIKRFFLVSLLLIRSTIRWNKSKFIPEPRRSRKRGNFLDLWVNNNARSFYFAAAVRCPGFLFWGTHILNDYNTQIVITNFILALKCL